MQFLSLALGFLTLNLSARANEQEFDLAHGTAHRKLLLFPVTKPLVGLIELLRLERQRRRHQGNERAHCAHALSTFTSARFLCEQQRLAGGRLRLILSLQRESNLSL